MIRSKYLSTVVGAGALALLSSAPFAQTSSTNNQAVSPSASSSVNANTQFKAMPHSTVTVSPSATTNQNVSTTQATNTTSTTGASGTSGTTGSQPGSSSGTTSSGM